MKSLGYDFDSKELVAADYGAPTTRKRWYAIFRRDGKPIVWPEPTHTREQWVPVSTCIDWSNLGTSIFDRKKPLAEATQRRIAIGLEKFVINNPNPYILPNDKAAAFLIQYHSETTKNTARGQSLNEPLQTIDTSNRYGLVTAFITKFYKTCIGQQVTEPLHTITTSLGHFGLVSAFLIKYYGQGIGQSITEPLGTIVTKDRFGLVTVKIKGEPYQITDIYLRMLKPEELKLAQGFPKDYIIDRDYNFKSYPKSKQVERIGNSVVPIMAQRLVEANCGYLKVGERAPHLTIDYSQQQLKFA